VEGKEEEGWDQSLNWKKGVDVWRMHRIETRSERSSVEEMDGRQNWLIGGRSTPDGDQVLFFSFLVLDGCARKIMDSTSPSGSGAETFAGSWKRERHLDNAFPCWFRELLDGWLA
jgi:hypothetical protein